VLLRLEDSPVPSDHALIATLTFADVMKVAIGLPVIEVAVLFSRRSIREENTFGDRADGLIPLWRLPPN
jgi:hypothetical protein